MKHSLNRIFFLVGAFVLALVAIDGLIQLNNSALSEYGAGESELVKADSAAALFLVGLVAGMVLGIGIFFATIAWRSKKYAEEPDEIALLLEEIAREEEANALIVEENNSAEENNTESSDPWERSADWWKNADDE